MEEQRVYNGGCIQDAFRSVLRCLGLESGGGNDHVASDDEVVVADNPPPPQQPPLELPTTYESLPTVGESSTVDPLVEVLSSSIDSITTTMDVNKTNVGDESNSSTLVSIDEIVNNGGGTTTEARFVELIEGNATFITASLISSGGGGQTHSLDI
ncbi:uncharacterized protein LOC112511694 [Cynara cardunculus var. scolymus]|uniref:uncharacterized protein LOC112511694 n=1 Tax=Cynara cardunculus var. scolymus TaxID=59895 RepID=UPI000D623FDF|nr:uncharacterized protein LOC112511694 [Cynara cardunculus var. scolymus]